MSTAVETMPKAFFRLQRISSYQNEKWSVIACLPIEKLQASQQVIILYRSLNGLRS
jgi:hypothetical protein